MKQKINRKQQQFSKSNKFKQPDTTKNIINYDNEKPVFSFIYSVDKKYGIDECTTEEKLSFLKTMLKLSECSWIMLKSADKHGLGYEKIDKINTSLPPQVTDEVQLIAFRFYDKAPMVGFRQERTFHIIFFDRDFTLYDH
jgi:hypothetical protein